MTHQQDDLDLDGGIEAGISNSNAARFPGDSPGSLWPVSTGQRQRGDWVRASTPVGRLAQRALVGSAHSFS